jgi:hypothetical protein
MNGILAQTAAMVIIKLKRVNWGGLCGTGANERSYPRDILSLVLRVLSVP